MNKHWRGSTKMQIIMSEEDGLYLASFKEKSHDFS